VIIDNVNDIIDNNLIICRKILEDEMIFPSKEQ
jgi:hypothetical protein